MMGMWHYRGGGVGRIKGFVSQGCGWRAGRPAGRPYGDWTGARGTYADGPFGQTLFPPPAHTLRASARAAPGHGDHPISPRETRARL